jgi:hypothetical protein
MLARDKVERVAAVLGTSGVSDTVDAALERVLMEDARRRLIDGTYDFSGVNASLEHLRGQRQVAPDDGSP